MGTFAFVYIIPPNFFMIDIIPPFPHKHTHTFPMLATPLQLVYALLYIKVQKTILN